MAGGSFDDVARDFLKLAGIPRARPDLALLERLTCSFGRLPYENLTKIIRAHEHADVNGRLRTPDIVLAEHLDLGAGGTCFSLTAFFEEVLRFAGFAPAPVLCDRSYGRATHCALVVELKGERYLVDPGYLLEAPLVIPKAGESLQRGSALTVRLMRLGNTGQLVLLTERAGVAKLRYRLRDVPVAPEEFHRRWIDSFGFAMMRHLCVSQMVGGRQLYLRDGMMRNVRRDRQQQESVEDDLARTIAKTFGIDPRLAHAARAYLEQSAAAHRLTKEGR